MDFPGLRGCSDPSSLPWWKVTMTGCGDFCLMARLGIEYFHQGWFFSFRKRWKKMCASIFFGGVGWRPGGSRKVFFFFCGDSSWIPLGKVCRSRSEGNGQIVYNSEVCHNFNYQGLVYRHRQIDSDRGMDHRGSAARAWKMRSETECQDLATPQSNQSWHAFWDSYVDVIIVSPGGTGTFFFLIVFCCSFSGGTESLVSQ